MSFQEGRKVCLRQPHPQTASQTSLCLEPACKTRQAGREPTVGTHSLFSVLCLDRVQQLLQNNPGSHFLRFPPNCVASQVQVCLLSVHLLLCSLDRSTHVLMAGKLNTAVTILIYLKYWLQTHCTTCWTSFYILPGLVCIAKQKSTQSLVACSQKHKPGNQEDEENQKEEKNLTQNNGSSSLSKDLGEKAYFQEKNKHIFSFFPTILQCNKVMLF